MNGGLFGVDHMVMWCCPVLDYSSNSINLNLWFLQVILDP